MNYDSTKLTEAIVEEGRRRLVNESLPRMTQCLEQLTDDQIWWKPNKNSNSVGNIIVHVNGNLRQWVLSAIAGQPDERQRNIEFEMDGGISGTQLIEMLQATMREVSTALDEVVKIGILEIRPVQVFEESILSIIVHVVEHTSYHTGQVTWITKMLVDGQLNYYGNTDLG